MDRILYTAVAGARQSLDRQSVISNNLANVDTAGFRAQLTATRAVPLAGGALDTRTSVTATTPASDFSTGPVNATGRDLDVAIQGNGWLAVQDADGTEAYTRRGDLQVDSNGVINSAGRPVIGDGGPLVVPLGAQLAIGADGTVSAIGAGEDPESLATVGRLKLVDPGEAGLVRGADGLFRGPPGDDGEPAAPLPRDENVRVMSGSLEGSNVSAVEAMVSMIDNARRYEMQMKVIDNANDNEQRANNLLSVQN